MTLVALPQTVKVNGVDLAVGNGSLSIKAGDTTVEVVSVGGKLIPREDFDKQKAAARAATKEAEKADKDTADWGTAEKPVQKRKIVPEEPVRK